MVSKVQGMAEDSFKITRNMAQKSQISTGVEALLKRKPISELRLQDPELWDKVSWIRTNFVKDLDSGIRKMDFCNFVTEHLGRTGYRDVWHLLKIAYPHVDRVRKGRKYMYWGIRHAGNTLEHKTETKGGSEKSTLPKECNNNNNYEVKEKSLTRIESEQDAMPSNRSPSVVVKTEKLSDEEDTAKPDSFLIMEFKEKAVFESFEDYEKSKEERSPGGEAERCVTPPLEIFTENQMVESPELSSKKIENDSQTNKQPEKQDEASTSNSTMDYQSELQQRNEPFAPNLLKPENINRVCIPLIHDNKKRARKSKGDDDTAEDTSITTPSKASFDPVIVSVASIGHAQFQSNLINQPNQTVDSSQDPADDVQVVVVQDRGIQVCESPSTTIQRRKRNALQAKSTDSNTKQSNKTKTAQIRADKDTNSRKKLKQTATGNVVCTTCTITKAPLPVESIAGKQIQASQLGTANLIRVPSVPVNSLMSRGYTVNASFKTPLQNTGKVSAVTKMVPLPAKEVPPSAKGVPPSTNGVPPSAKGVPTSAKGIPSSTRLMTSLLPERNGKSTEATLDRTRQDQIATHYRTNNDSIDNQIKSRGIQDHGLRQNPTALRPVTENPTPVRPITERPQGDYNQFRNRELIRKLLEEHETQRNSTSYSPENDLQYTVDCLSTELEKERTLRLRLEIELRKVENQLDQERKLNERLAALLMKR